MRNCQKIDLFARCLFLLLFPASVLLAGQTAGGEDYRLSYQGIPHDSFYDMCTSEQQSFVVGAYGTVLMKEHQKTKWQPVDKFSSHSLFGIACVDDTVLSVGQQGSIYRKEGQTWLAVESGTDERLLAVAMNSQGLAIVVGGFGTVLRSLDAGKNWKPLQFDWESIIGDFVEPHLYDIDVREDGSVTIVGEFGLVLRSDDKGENWNKVHHGEASLFSLHFSDRLNAYTVGQSATVLRTMDGGLSWQRLTVPGDANLLGVWSSTVGEVFITGIRMLLRSKEDSDSWDVIQNKDAQEGWYQPIIRVGPGANTLFIAGHSGRIIQIKL